MARKGISVTAASGLATADGLDPADRIALDALGDTISDLYDVGYAAGEYFAFRLTGGPLLSADTLAGLDSAIQTDRIRCRRIAGYAR